MTSPDSDARITVPKKPTMESVMEMRTMVSLRTIKPSNGLAIGGVEYRRRDSPSLKRLMPDRTAEVCNELFNVRLHRVVGRRFATNYHASLLDVALQT
jgi:hypothetical protein